MGRTFYKGTEFQKWRYKNEQAKNDLDSKKGFVCTDIDLLWKNYKTGKYMLLEEKTHNSKPKYAQIQLIKHFHNLAKDDKDYFGFHLIVFENTNPENGKTYLDGKEVEGRDIIEFLKFDKPKKWYKTNKLFRR